MKKCIAIVVAAAVLATSCVFPVSSLTTAEAAVTTTSVTPTIKPAASPTPTAKLTVSPTPASTISTSTLAAANYNYVDAFAKSILFYEANWSGPDAGNNRLKWRC